MSGLAEQGAQDEAIEAVCKSLHPKLEAIVHQYCDEAYAAIMESTQDYLCDNAQFNIASKLETANREASYAREQVKRERSIKAELLEALQGLSNILNSAESNASGNPEWEAVSKRINAARAAIAKATGQ